MRYSIDMNTPVVIIFFVVISSKLIIINGLSNIITQDPKI